MSNMKTKITKAVERILQFNKETEGWKIRNLEASDVQAICSDLNLTNKQAAWSLKAAKRWIDPFSKDLIPYYDKIFLKMGLVLFRERRDDYTINDLAQAIVQVAFNS